MTEPPTKPDKIPFARPLTYATPQSSRRPSASNVLMNLLGGGFFIFLGGGGALGVINWMIDASRGSAIPVPSWGYIMLIGGGALATGGVIMIVSAVRAMLR